MPNLPDPIGQAQLDPMQAAASAAQSNPLQEAVANSSLPSALTPDAVDQMTKSGYLPPGQWTPQQAAEIVRSPDYAPQTPPVPSVLANSAPPKPDVSHGTGQLAPTPTAASMFGLGDAGQQQQAQGVLAAAQRAGGSPVVPYAPPPAPTAPVPARNPLQAQAAGGPAFDPFANQKIAAKGEEGALLNRKLGVAAGGGMRDEALGAAGAENARYTQEAEHAARMQRAEAAKLDKRHEDLIKSEGARDLVAEYWKNKGVGGSSLAFISAAAGGFLQGWRGLATNPGLDNLNKDIDRHIQASQENSQLKINADKTLYDHFRDKTHDANEARALTHAATLDSLGADLEKARAATKDQEEIGHIDDQLQAVRMQTAQWKDAAKASAMRANAPKTTEQLLAEQKALTEIKHIEAETGKTGAETNKLQAEAAAAAAAGTPGGSVPAPVSTDYDLRRLFQDTDAFADKQGQDRWNSQVLAKLHKANPVRSPDILEAMASAYKVGPGDTKSTVDRKVAAFQEDYQKGGGNPLQAQAAGADKDPASFAAP